MRSTQTFDRFIGVCVCNINKETQRKIPQREGGREERGEESAPLLSHTDVCHIGCKDFLKRLLSQEQI